MINGAITDRYLKFCLVKLAAKRTAEGIRGAENKFQSIYNPMLEVHRKKKIIPPENARDRNIFSVENLTPPVANNGSRNQIRGNTRPSRLICPQKYSGWNVTKLARMLPPRPIPQLVSIILCRDTPRLKKTTASRRRSR